jgi:hypothetical protein
LIIRAPTVWRNLCAVTRTGRPAASRASQSASQLRRRLLSALQQKLSLAVGVLAQPGQQDRRRLGEALA